MMNQSNIPSFGDSTRNNNIPNKCSKHPCIACRRESYNQLNRPPPKIVRLADTLYNKVRQLCELADDHYTKLADEPTNRGVNALLTYNSDHRKIQDIATLYLQQLVNQFGHAYVNMCSYEKTIMRTLPYSCKAPTDTTIRWVSNLVRLASQIRGKAKDINIVTVTYDTFLTISENDIRYLDNQIIHFEEILQDALYIFSIFIKSIQETSYTPPRTMLTVPYRAD